MSMISYSNLAAFSESGPDGAATVGGYLKMPRRLGEKYFHRQLLEDFGVAYAGHEMVIHHEDEDICNNSFENLSFVTRQMHAQLHHFGGAH